MATNGKPSASTKPASSAVAAVAPSQASATAVAPLPLTKVAAKANGKPAAAKSAPANKATAKTTINELKTEQVVKAKRVKLVRDSFTIPKNEYAVLDDLKQRAIKLGKPIKKSELLRAGIQALAAMPVGAFLASLKAVQTIKTGRPAND